MERRVLGKGLEALIPKRPQEETSFKEFAYLPVEQVRLGKYQPRQKIDDKELQELSKSIKEKGFIQPIVVRRVDDKTFEVVAGARRFHCAKLLGINKIPTLIRELDDKDTFMLAIAENLQREDLNPLEEALAFKRLIEEFGLTQDGIGKFLGKDKSSIANTLRLLKLPVDIQKALSQGVITRTQARTILSLEKESEQEKMFHQILQEGLSVREIERRVKRVSPKKRKEEDPFVIDMEEKMQKTLGTKVKIANKKNNSGKITIEYYNLQDLERISKSIL
ncbi:MAG: ParB/RepB/Spo0J family partition protein [Candidatus Omnitrophota bacterium]